MNAPISPGSLAAPITTYSSREFTRDVAAAKRAAANGPVFITDRGQPAFALLSIEDYQRLASQIKEPSLLDIMDAIPGGDFDWEPPKLSDVMRPIDLD